MTAITPYPGTPLADMRRRQVGRGFWLPGISDQGVNAATSSRPNATVTASATPHTVGPWVEFITATTKEVTLLTVFSKATTIGSGANTSSLLSVSTGAAGDEANHLLVANLPFGYAGQNGQYTIPVAVPAGTRLSMAAQSAIVSKTLSIVLLCGLLPFGRRPANHVITLGADTATSRGVTLTDPGATNAKGAWVQIVAATTEPFGSVILGLQGAGSNALGTANCLVDVGIGSAGNETAIISDVYAATTSSEEILQTRATYPVDIPAGARIVARHARSAATTLDLILLGCPRQ